MNIKVSKVFAKFINTTAKEMGFEAHAEVVAISKTAYSFCTGTDLWDAGDDYDYSTGTCRVIEITYPYDFYATRKFLTTHGLCTEFNRRGIRTVEELKEMLRDMLEI